MRSVIHKQHTQRQQEEKETCNLMGSLQIIPSLSQAIISKFSLRSSLFVIETGTHARCTSSEMSESHGVCLPNTSGCSPYASGSYFCDCGCHLCLTCFYEIALSMRCWQCKSPRRKSISEELNSLICLRCHDCHLSDNSYNDNSKNAHCLESCACSFQNTTGFVS